MLINIWNLPPVPTLTAQACGKQKVMFGSLRCRDMVPGTQVVAEAIFSISAEARKCQERDSKLPRASAFDFEKALSFEAAGYLYLPLGVTAGPFLQPVASPAPAASAPPAP